MKSITQKLFTIPAMFFMASAAYSDVLNVDLLVKEIKSAPSWTQMTQNQIPTDGPKLIAILNKFVVLSPDDARKLVKALQVAASKTFDTDLDGKVYIFNRLYCRVPDKVDQSTWKFFGGGNGIPVNNGQVYALYPLVQKSDGRLELAGAFGGYGGPVYRGLNEFDFLFARFGRRSKEK